MRVILECFGKEYHWRNTDTATDQKRVGTLSRHLERMTDRVIAIVDGKLAAAGDISAIRRAMSYIPYRVLIECDRPRELGAALIDNEAVFSVTVAHRGLHVETSDLSTLGSVIAQLAQDLDTRLSRFAPEDESLESVFRYLVERR